MGIDWNPISLKASGGTEIMARELEKRLSSELMNEFQIIPSRVMNPLDPTKIRVLWLHDLPGDPASEHLANGGWTKFHVLVFVSNWQMQAYIARYGIPWSRCVVLHNAIDTQVIKKRERKGNGPVRLVYTTTPHRGLDVLFAVFQKLAEKHDVVLDVYSSFGVYGPDWAGRDEQFKPMFEEMKKHEKINYHGAVKRERLLQEIATADVFAYPSTWLETSCLCLIEAMFLGLDCVHPNYGALYETGANFTSMYQWTDDKNLHSGRLLSMLETAVTLAKHRPENWTNRLEWMSQYASTFYSWEARARQWEILLKQLVNLPRQIEDPVPAFVYSA